MMRYEMRPKLNPGIIVRKEEGIGIGIVFDTMSNNQEFYNETGIDVLELCNGDNDIHQIIGILKDSYNVDRKQIETDVAQFIEEQKDKGIISLL